MEDTDQADGFSAGLPRRIFITGTLIREIIRNPVHRGVVRVRVQNRDVSPGTVASTEWEEFKGRHEALVSEEVWFRANRMLPKSKTPSEGVQRKPKIHSMGLLQGLLCCGCCNNAAMCPGAASRTRKSGGKHWYYRCSQKAKGASASECTTKQISGTAVETAIVVLLQAVEANAAILVRMGYDPRTRKRESEIADCRSEILRLDAQIEQYRREVGNLLGFIQRGEAETLASDAMTKAHDIKTALANLENQRIQQETRLHKLFGRVPQVSELGTAFGPVAKALQFANHAQKYEILHQIIKSIILRRVAVGGISTPRSPTATRTFRMAIEIKTDSLMKFGKTDFESVQALRGFSNVVLKVTFEIHSNAKEQKVILLEQGYACVATKFVEPEVAPPPEPSSHKENPIQRAIRWKRLITLEKETAVAISKREDVSEGLISQYQALLELPQLIVDFLKEGRERGLKRPFTLRELQRLRSLPPSEAVAVFHARVAGSPVQGALLLENLAIKQDMPTGSILSRAQ